MLFESDTENPLCEIAFLSLQNNQHLLPQEFCFVSHQKHSVNVCVRFTGTFLGTSHWIVTVTYSRAVVSTRGPHALIHCVSPQVFTAQVQRRRRTLHVQSSIQAAMGEDGVADTYTTKERSRKWKEMWACFTHKRIIYSLWNIYRLPLFLSASVKEMNFFF